jgi:hypothetical protein
VGLVACPFEDVLAFGGAEAAAFARGAEAAAFARGAEAAAFARGSEAAAFTRGAEAVVGRAARLPLRRCGRRCGSADRTSEGDEFRSVIARFRRCWGEIGPELKLQARSDVVVLLLNAVSSALAGNGLADAPAGRPEAD